MELAHEFREQTPEQKAYKQAKENFKKKIKEAELAQRTYKDNRKTVRFVGVRTMPANEASARHAHNRFSLKHMYLAYAIMRAQFGGYTKIDLNHHKLYDGYDEAIVTKYVKENAPKTVRIDS